MREIPCYVRLNFTLFCSSLSTIHTNTINITYTIIILCYIQLSDSVDSVVITRKECVKVYQSLTLIINDSKIIKNEFFRPKSPDG